MKYVEVLLKLYDGRVPERRRSGVLLVREGPGDDRGG